jgi:hypothetical protein
VEGDYPKVAMSEFIALPERTYGLVIGIERYRESSWNVKGGGPAHDALKFAQWLCECGVPKKNIRLCLSSLEENSDLVEQSELAVEEATEPNITSLITDFLSEKKGDLLYLFWAGHGLITSERDRRLLCADATKQNWQNLDLNSLLVFLGSDRFQIQNHICIVDACASYILESKGRPTNLGGKTFSSGQPRKESQQFVLLATREGEQAKVSAEGKTGYFSQAVREALEEEANDSWPPNMETIAEKVKQRLAGLEKKQLPTYFYRRSWDGDIDQLNLDVAKTRRSSTLGARESNAGDEFHVLWAARRAVQLLNPRSGLCQVEMENVSPVDADGVDEAGDLFLGVDLTEYYDGKDFFTAAKVITSQLKYSTRHPTKAWTASRLCAVSEKGQASVIQRLADIYKGFVLKNPRDEVIRKLSIRLVSNQPAAADLPAVLSNAQEVLKAIAVSTQIQTAQLLKQLPAQNHDVIKALQAGTGLTSGEFTDFLRILDLSSCGEEARAFQRLRLIQELRPSVSNNPTAALRDLCDLIRREALPETEQSKGLSEHEVLAALGVYDKEALLPAPSHVQPVKRVIETSEAKDLANTITTASCGKVLAHGNAGVGKTTTVQALSKYLPSGSLVIVYDCFGGGSYLVAGDERHTHKRALLQLTNELAVHCGTPFLIQSAHEKPDLYRNFRKSLEMASKIVAAQDGLLVIVIDAADNAIIAAEDIKDCFVPDLWSIPIPENCRLLMTSRSHRRATLKPPSRIVEFELKGFDEEASTAHLQQIFPNVDIKSGALFHDHTNGNPRVQYYLLDKAETAGANEESLAQLLEDSRRTPDAIFGDLLEAAVEHSSQPDKSQQQLAALICLTRPVPIHVFADAVGISLAEAYNFCRALVPGLVLENDEASFRDEDFETYLRDRQTPDELTSAQRQLGEHFLTRATQDSYAAKVVAEHLFRAKQYQEVINLAIAGLDASVIQDNILRLQSQRRRITLAMKSACELGYEDEAVCLILLAAETARSDSAVTALVRENPELAARYGDTDGVARLYSRNENDSWLGSVHLRTAAMYARDPAQRDRAEDHLRSAEAWIRRRSALPKHERHRWNLSLGDIACGAEAVFWLEGAEAAKQWLTRWRPISAVVDALKDLATSLAKQLSQEQLEEVLQVLKLPLWAVAMILGIFYQTGNQSSNALVSKVAEQLYEAIRQGRKYSRVRGTWSIAFCEIAVLSGVDVEQTQQLLTVLCPPFPQTAPYNHFDLPGYDASLKVASLQSALAGKELTTDELLPERYRPQEGHKDQFYEQRQRFHEIIGKVLGVYRVRTRTIVEQLAVTDIAEALSDELAKRLKESGYRWFKSDLQYALWAEKVCESLLNCSGDAESLLEEIADAAEPIMHGAAPRLWIDLAERMMLQGAYRSLAYHLLERAAQYVIDQPFPGRDRWQTLLRCASVVSRYDEELGRDYYKRSLAAAESIDDDSVYLLSWLSRLAHQIAPSLSVEDRCNFSIRLAHIVEAHKDYVSEPSELPWKATLCAVSRLDAANGLALCSRWDDENHFQLEDGIITVVKEVTETDFLSPLEGLWLLRLAGERHDVSKDAIPLLEKLRTRGVSARPQLVQMMQALSYWVRRDIPLAERTTAATRIVEWADAHGMGQLAGIAELRELISFGSSLPPREDRDSSSPYRPTATREPKFDITLGILILRFSSESVSLILLLSYVLHPTQIREFIVQSIIDNARSGSFADLETQLRQVWMNAGSSSTVEEFLTTFGRSVAPSQGVDYLNELISLDVSISLVHEIAIALQTYLTQWRNSTIIQDWIPEGIGKFLELHLPALLVSWYGSVVPLETVLSVPNLAGQTRAALLLPAITQHLESLSPQELYKAAKSLAVPLPPAKLRDILDWSITRVETQIEQGREIRPVLQTQLPDTSPAVLAHFFWALFGHPDKRVRWRALHAARAIIKLPNPALLEELVNLSWSETVGAFRSPQLEFYWISARTWLMLLFQRLSDECPQMLQQYAQAIADHALNCAFPHTQIRELAKQAALCIVKHEPRSLPPDIVEQLNFTNAPSACLYPREDRYELRTSSWAEVEKVKTESRFSFDSMDTLPYWYNRPSSVFGYAKPDIAATAEKWICDNWGRTDQDWYEDQRDLSDRYDWGEKSNRHGSIPRVENLRIYLEYHAMLCAAGEMIDELMPVAVDTYEDAGCPWEEWIQGHLCVSPNYWLADLRLPTPYRPDSWGQFPPIKEWLKQYPLEEFDSGLGLIEPGHTGEIVIWGDIDLYDSERVGHIRTTSALVNPVTARSLLHALQTTSHHSYQLPVGGRGYGEFEISELGFELESWLEVKSQDGEALDKFDPLTKQSRLESEFITLSSNFVKSVNLNKPPGCWEYVSTDGHKIAYLEFWSDNLQEQHVTKAFSSGKRWWIQVESLLEYLKQRERDLIIEVQIAHNRWHERREEGEEYDSGATTIYLLRRDGTLETLDSRREVRQTDRERTRSGR